MNVSNQVHVRHCEPTSDVAADVCALLQAICPPERLHGARRVFIKPNLVTDNAEYIAQGANTDTRVIEGVLQYLGRFPHLQVTLGESETGSRTKGRRLQRALDLMGVTALQQRYPFTIANMTHLPQRDYPIAGGTWLQHLRLAEVLMDADLIINLPKLKTHKYSTITCALKNMFGAIPDPLRVVYHRDIHRVICDLNLLFNGRTVVLLDGLVGMEGAGPLYGTRVPMNLLLAGTEPLYVDAAAAAIMGFEPASVRHIALHGVARGLDPAAFELRGATLADVRRPFEPSRRNLFVRAEGELMRHRWIVRILMNDWFRMHVTRYLHPLLRRLRGGSFSWYLDDPPGPGRPR